MASSVEMDPGLETSKDQTSSSGADDNRNAEERSHEDSTTDKTDGSNSIGGEKTDSNEEKKIPEQDKHPKLPKGLPPIDLKELNTVLRHPNMPSKKILHEVADKVISSNENKGIDGSGGITEMKGLFDCILEVSLKQTESDNSDEEEEDEQSFDLKFPCVYCQKVFLSSMEMKTHILVLHSKEDPSVLNLTQLIANDSQKVSLGHRRSRESSKADNDTKEQKSAHSPRVETAVKVVDENVPVNHPQSSSPRSQRKPSKSGSESGTSITETDSQTDNVLSCVESLESDIHSEKNSATPSKIDPNTSGKQSPKDSSQISASSQQFSEVEAKSEQTKSVIDTSGINEGPTSKASTSIEIAASSEESKSPRSNATKKRGKKEEDKEAALSAVKRGRRTRTSQAEESMSHGQDSKPSRLRSSRRH